jgi:transcriptional regulator with XRE-family HTH domain
MIEGEDSDAFDRHAGAIIKRCRESAALSQERLGHALGLSAKEVESYERGERVLDRGLLLRFARALGVPVTCFFGKSYALVDIARFPPPNEARELLRSFVRVPDPSLRRSILALVRGCADH